MRKATQEVKEYLSRFVHIDRRIDRLIERRERYEALAMRRTASYSDMPGGGQSQRSAVEENTLKMVEVDREINAEIDRLADMRPSITYMIGMLHDETQRDVMMWRYENGKTLPEIATKLCYSVDWIKHLHGEALNAMVPIYDYYNGETRHLTTPSNVLQC